MKNKKGMGIYIHIPFCVCKCVYCDFLSAPADESVKEAYVNALTEEIRLTADCLKEQEKDYRIDTIFIGGGTPTTIKPEDIVNILAELKNGFFISSNAEITIECNPGTLTKEKAECYRKTGINRISFGLQSADNQELKMLGRIHTLEQFRESFCIARNAGFDNINIDIMSALPGQTFESFQHTVETVVGFQPEHISAYSLILEEGTRLYERREEYPPFPNEDTERKMYDYVCRELSTAGYQQYEISNFAKENAVCRHNLSYWERKDYLGFGIGAASLFEECRYANTQDIQEYIKKLEGSAPMLSAIRKDKTSLSIEEQMEEYMFLGLRKIAGISPKEFAELFHTDIESVYGEVLKKNVQYGLLQMQNDRIALTRHGIDVSNVVMADFLLT